MKKSIMQRVLGMMGKMHKPSVRHIPYFVRHTRRERGFTLLLAALVSSIVLALGASIFEIASKEVALSAIGRDSQFAFYAADEAAECALYWDLRFGYFATSAPESVTDPNPQCDGQTLTGSGRAATYPYTITFTFEPQGYCANVAVEKTLSEQGVVRTTIHADGFSTSCATQLTSPRSLQRSVELHY